MKISPLARLLPVTADTFFPSCYNLLLTVPDKLFLLPGKHPLWTTETDRQIERQRDRGEKKGLWWCCCASTADAFPTSWHQTKPVKALTLNSVQVMPWVQENDHHLFPPTQATVCKVCIILSIRNQHLKWFVRLDLNKNKLFLLNISKIFCQIMWNWCSFYHPSSDHYAVIQSLHVLVK